MDTSTIIVITAVASSSAVFGLKKLIESNLKHYFDKKLDKIVQENNEKNMLLQNELSKLNANYQLKFTKHYEQTFVVVQQLYKHLYRTIDYLGKYVYPVKYIEEEQTLESHTEVLQQQFVSEYEKLKTLFLDNRIFFTKELDDLLSQFLIESNSIFSDFFEMIFYKKNEYDVDSEVQKKAYSAYKKIPIKLVPIKDEIEQNLRDFIVVK